MLKIDFYESGVGETIIITFPDGGLGIVDAHPSKEQSRPGILDIVASSKIHFLCLTHPHADHAKDLVILAKEKIKDIDSFWHTCQGYKRLLYYITQYKKYPSAELFQIIHDTQKAEAECIIDLYSNKDLRQKRHLLRSDLEVKKIAGVEIFTLGPTERIYNDFVDKCQNSIEGHGAKCKEPDVNLLSAILLLKYGKFSIVLGGDALKTNWFDAVEKFRDLACPPVKILKVPHHGAKNSYFSGRINKKRKEQISYLNVCNQNSFCILFAGDNKHPDYNVFQELKSNSKPICLANGLKAQSSDPLNLSMVPGARYVSDSPICNPLISFECFEDGNIKLKEGKCSNCKT
jgi:hypothetical protein